MSTLYRFDRFELHPARRQLLDDGAEIDVGGRAFDLLVALVERRDRVVSRDELYALVWPSVSVELNNLHVQIWRLRNQLGDKTIRTVARQGYQFAADIEAIELPTGPTKVPAWFEPMQRTDDDGGVASSLTPRFDVTLRRHHVVSIIDADDARRRQRLESALADLPPMMRRGMLRYDIAELRRRVPAEAGEAGALKLDGGKIVPHLMRAVLRAAHRNQIVVLLDAHASPTLTAAAAWEILRHAPRTRIIVSARVPVGLPDEHVLPDTAAASEADVPRAAPSPDVYAEQKRSLRWRPRGSPA